VPCQAAIREASKPQTYPLPRVATRLRGAPNLAPPVLAQSNVCRDPHPQSNVCRDPHPPLPLAQRAWPRVRLRGRNQPPVISLFLFACCHLCLQMTRFCMRVRTLTWHDACAHAAMREQQGLLSSKQAAYLQHISRPASAPAKRAGGADTRELMPL